MTLVYLVLALPILAYLGLPLVIKVTLRINARPELQSATLKYLPEDVREYLEPLAPKLSVLGFEQEACFVIPDSMPNTTAHVGLWLNRNTGQAAAASVLISNPGGDKPPIIKSYLEFLTKFGSGRTVTTSNSSELGAFKPVKELDALTATRLTEPAQLYQLHCWRESKSGGGTAGKGAAPQEQERFLPSPGAAMQWFADAYEESFAKQVGTGYLQRVSGEPTLYVPTIQGAYAMTWAQLPPMKGMKRSAETARAEAQIRQASNSPVRPPTNVRITHRWSSGTTKQAA